MSVILRSLPSSITSLSDDQLRRKLQVYNPDYGPILPTTRSVYERKLYALETGGEVEALGEYPPADGDEDEIAPSRTPPPAVLLKQRAIRETEKKEVYTGRFESGKPLARRPLHPESRGYYPQSRGAAPTTRRPAASDQRGPQNEQRGWRVPCPVWLITVVVAVILLAVLAILVMWDTQSEPADDTPEKLDMV